MNILNNKLIEAAKSFTRSKSISLNIDIVDTTDKEYYIRLARNCNGKGGVEREKEIEKLIEEVEKCKSFEDALYRHEVNITGLYGKKDEELNEKLDEKTIEMIKKTTSCAELLKFHWIGPSGHSGLKQAINEKLDELLRKNEEECIFILKMYHWSPFHTEFSEILEKISSEILHDLRIKARQGLLR